MKASLRPAAQANPSESASSGPTITQRPVCDSLRRHEQPPSCAQRPLRTWPLTARPGLFDLHTAGLASEIVMTFGFLIVILGATSRLAPSGFAGIPIGLALTLIHLVSIPVTNTSVNPARSTGPALFVGDWAIGQLWLFWVAPIIGAALAGLVYNWLGSED